MGVGGFSLKRRSLQCLTRRSAPLGSNSCVVASARPFSNSCSSDLAVAVCEALGQKLEPVGRGQAELLPETLHD